MALWSIIFYKDCYPIMYIILRFNIRGSLKMNTTRMFLLFTSAYNILIKLETPI